MKSPDRIYLQDDTDEPDDVTWCGDCINDNDTEYVRGDIHAAAIARIERLEAALALCLPILQDDVVDVDSYRCYYCGAEEGEHTGDCRQLVAFEAARAALEPQS